MNKCVSCWSEIVRGSGVNKCVSCWSEIVRGSGVNKCVSGQIRNDKAEDKVVLG